MKFLVFSGNKFNLLYSEAYIHVYKMNHCSMLQRIICCGISSYILLIENLWSEHMHTVATSSSTS